MNRLMMTGAVVVLSGCYAAPEQMDDAVPPAALTEATATPKVEAASPASAGACDMAKFTFTQATGCLNDGWVEFCAKKTGAAVVSQLRAIAPDLTIDENQIGRAGCDELNDYRVMDRLDLPVECMQYHGALTSSSWERLCQLAAVPETSHFVGGWAE